MKSEIVPFKFPLLNNETHVEINEIINQMIINATPEKLGLQNFYPPYKASLNNEMEALDFISKSNITSQIRVQDKVRNSVFRGLSDVIKGMTNHYIEAVRADAVLLWNIFQHYGSMANRTLDSRTSAIKDLLSELSTSANRAAMEHLAVAEWADALGAENTRLRSLMLARYKESNTRTKLRMQTCRRETDMYLRAIFSDIDNRKLIGTATPDLDSFITELNVVITRFKTIIAQAKRTKSETKK